MKIAVVFPTRNESIYFKRDDVELFFCGVGVIASTYAITKYISTNKPDLVIMGGIAGAYKGSKLKIGDSVLVGKERISDFGFFDEEGFKHFTSIDMDFDKSTDILCPHITADMPFQVATSNTMNCAMAPFVKTSEVDIENMEGAGLFYACTKENIKFLELRTISNEVNLKHDDWDYDTSIKNLTHELNRLIDYIKK